MNDDIVKELRAVPGATVYRVSVFDRAADEIERLREGKADLITAGQRMIDANVKREAELEVEIERLRASIDADTKYIAEADEESERLRERLESQDEKIKNLLISYDARKELCKGAYHKIKRLREALEIIADHYIPNWKPGDTHETGQRFAKIAHEALQPAQERQSDG